MNTQFSAAHRAGLRKAEAKFLRCLLSEPRDNRWVQGHFGMGLAFDLARRGLATNLLGETETSHTNLWSITGQGLAALSPREFSQAKRFD